MKPSIITDARAVLQLAAKKAEAEIIGPKTTEAQPTFSEMIVRAFGQTIDRLVTDFADKAMTVGEINVQTFWPDRMACTTEFVDALAERLLAAGLEVTLESRHRHTGLLEHWLIVSWDWTAVT